MSSPIVPKVRLCTAEALGHREGGQILFAYQPMYDTAIEENIRVLR